MKNLLKSKATANLAGNLGSRPLLFSREAKLCWRKRFTFNFFSFFSSIFLVSISWPGITVVKGPQRGGSAVTRACGHPGEPLQVPLPAVTSWPRGVLSLNGC